MEAITETRKGNGKRAPRARQGKDKQEGVLKNSALKERIDELVRLKVSADEASQNLNDAIKAAAEKSGYLASIVRKVVVAKAGEDFEEKQREAEQLELCFEAVA